MPAAAALLVASAFVLAGERVPFDGQARPQFTGRQIASVESDVRAGFARWAATPTGRRIIEHLNAKEYEVIVAEDRAEEGAGRAPQPGLATLVAAGDHAAHKTYVVIINPELRVPQGKNVFPSMQPATQADMMAAAWAGEMLHVEFYARGISLPHHARSDFQQEWRNVARELGYPDMRHEDDERAIRYAARY